MCATNASVHYVCMPKTSRRKQNYVLAKIYIHTHTHIYIHTHIHTYTYIYALTVGSLELLDEGSIIVLADQIGGDEARRAVNLSNVCMDMIFIHVHMHVYT